jgi:hypothetical protein
MGVLYAALSELAAKVQQEETALQEKVQETLTSCGIESLINRCECFWYNGEPHWQDSTRRQDSER